MKLKFSQEEILTSHNYVRPHMVAGTRLHGGFLPSGEYKSPRTNIRADAVKNWTRALRARGWDLLKADSSLLAGPRMPNVAQQCLLIREGLGQIFWNILTITGKIEARGQMLATAPFPDLRDLVVEPIDEMAIGHMNRGLLIAHGIDEGGEPENDIGGHDKMWFVARDLAFGEDAYPDVQPPGPLGRNEEATRRMPDLALPMEAYLSFLMNLLVIEFRAEIGFAATQEILRTEDVFADRRDEAELAAEIVERIRTDELIHVESLRLYLGELRSVTLRKEDGGVIEGHEIVDPFWTNLIQWSTQVQPQQVAKASFDNVSAQIQKHPDSARIHREFTALNDPELQLTAD